MYVQQNQIREWILPAKLRFQHILLASIHIGKDHLQTLQKGRRKVVSLLASPLPKVEENETV